eukprot:g39833.t1
MDRERQVTEAGMRGRVGGCTSESLSDLESLSWALDGGERGGIGAVANHINSPSHALSDMSILGLLQCHNDAIRKLNEQMAYGMLAFIGWGIEFKNWQKDMVALERVQRRFTRMLHGMEGISCEERLEKLELFSLNDG